MGLRFGIRIISSKKRERANLSVGFIKYYIIKKSERVDIGRYLHAFLISTLDRMSDQIHPKAVLPHEKEHPVTDGK